MPHISDEPVAASNESLTALRDLAAAKQELATLYAALDNVDSGLLLLNADLRAVYSNPALHGLFKSFSVEAIRHTKPFYADLLQGASAASAVDLQDYVARRLAWVRSGDPMPMDIPMANGSVLRCHLANLPGGGRMLIYSDVTDIVKNAEKMERLATTDGMTGIYNRRHFLALADREWVRARRYGRCISFLMIDIDQFKSINDTFGHQIGDEVIVHLANLARDCKRDSDVLARIGGEEFALLLPETDLQQAEIVAERLRNAVAATPLSATQGLCATVSIGVAAAVDQMVEISCLMRAADQALYEAKRRGRNRVVCSASETIAPSLAPSADAAPGHDASTIETRPLNSSTTSIWNERRELDRTS